MRVPDHSALSRLVDWAPRHGVLSVYLDIDPADRRATWHAVLRDDLKRAADSSHDTDRERWLAVKATAERILERFPGPEPHGPGRAHVGFVEARERDPREVWYGFQLPLRRTCAVHADRPQLRPLVELLDAGRPRAIAALSAERVRLFEWTLGRIVELADWDLDTATDDWRERKGPTMRDPARGQATTSAGRDQFDQRQEANRERFLKEAGEGAGELVGRRFSEVLVYGDPALLGPFAEGLGPKPAVRHLDGADVIPESPRQIAQRLGDSLENLNRARGLALVKRARDAAFAEGSSGSLGMQETAQALAAGRVRHLLFDAERDFQMGAAAEAVRFENGEAPDGPLDEWMIDQAIRISAEITPVAGEAAAALADHEGVAGLLRY